MTFYILVFAPLPQIFRSSVVSEQKKFQQIKPSLMITIWEKKITSCLCSPPPPRAAPIQAAPQPSCVCVCVYTYTINICRHSRNSNNNPQNKFCFNNLSVFSSVVNKQCEAFYCVIYDGTKRDHHSTPRWQDLGPSSSIHSSRLLSTYFNDNM